MTEQEKIIRAEITNLETQLEPIQAAIDERRKRLLTVLSPFAVGDTIKWGRRGYRGKIVDLGWWVCETPKWQVQRIKKDGTFGATCWVMSYDNPEKIPL